VRRNRAERGMGAGERWRVGEGMVNPPATAGVTSSHRAREKEPRCARDGFPHKTAVVHDFSLIKYININNYAYNRTIFVHYSAFVRKNAVY